jgi:hypothetical protein
MAVVMVLGMSVTALADTEPVIVIAEKPGGKITVKPKTGTGKPKELADGAAAVRDDEDWTIKIDGVAYDVPETALCEIEGKKRADGAMWLACNHSSGDFPHADLWYVPTFAKRVRITDGGSAQEGVWAPTPTAPSVVLADESLYVIDPVTTAVTVIERAGAPSWSPTGVLHYRTLDGGAWKLDAGKKTKLGKGKRGKESRGDLNSGIEPTRWPAAVTFKKDGKPAWK